MERLLGILFFLGVAGCCRADIPEHLITSLPGWSGPLPSRQYSGYINVSATKHMHYWFVESENNPKTDPIVLWLNGGPGCSSLDGYMKEMGPLHFNMETANVLPLPQLVYNKYTWTNITSIIFLESPVGVGFSYSDNPASDYNTDDNKTAIDNYIFLTEFFKYYPEYKENNFYIAGESYAGIYIPTLVEVIHSKSDENNFNLKGFMVGNGCIGTEVGACSEKFGLKIHVDFYHDHGLFPDALYQEMLTVCGDFTAPDQQCRVLLSEMSKEIGKIDIYDIYQPCNSNMGTIHGRQKYHLKELVMESTGKYEGPDECLDGHIEQKYFDNQTVRHALHVATVEQIGGWQLCSSKIDYHPNTKSLLPIYPTLISAYRTLIYNGDVDGCVPYIDNEQWTSGLGYKVKDGWRPWMVMDQVAGYVTEYEENDFKFVTVKGSGHMVPQFKPQAAWAMFNRFINNLPF